MGEKDAQVSGGGAGGRSDTDAELDSDLACRQEQVAAAEGELARSHPDVDDAEAVDTG